MTSNKIFVFVVFSFLATNIVAAEEVAFIYDSHGKRDPLRRLVTPEGTVLTFDNDLSLTDMVLEGIVASEEGKSMAIINGSVIRINEKIGEYIVSQIKEDEVTLTKGQEKFTLKLKKEE